MHLTQSYANTQQNWKNIVSFVSSFLFFFFFFCHPESSCGFLTFLCVRISEIKTVSELHHTDYQKCKHNVEESYPYQRYNYKLQLPLQLASLNCSCVLMEILKVSGGCGSIQHMLVLQGGGAGLRGAAGGTLQLQKKELVLAALQN